MDDNPVLKESKRRAVTIQEQLNDPRWRKEEPAPEAGVPEQDRYYESCGYIRDRVTNKTVARAYTTEMAEAFAVRLNAALTIAEGLRKAAGMVRELVEANQALDHSGNNTEMVAAYKQVDSSVHQLARLFGMEEEATPGPPAGTQV